MVIPLGVRTPAGCEESSHPVQGAVFMGFVVPVVRAEKRARTTGYCPFMPPAWQKRPNSSLALAKGDGRRAQNPFSSLTAVIIITGMPKPQIPDKLFFKIGEVCTIVGVEPYVLRFWETEFPFLAPQKSKSGHRIYKKKDVELVLKVKELLYDRGFTIAGARKQFSKARTVQGPQRDAVLKQVRSELMDILTLLRRKT